MGSAIMSVRAKQHARIADAIEAGDPDAAATAMLEVIDIGLGRVDELRP